MRKLKVLFVCSGNLDRSPTAEAMFRLYPGVEARSAGTLESAPTRLTYDLAKWADLILVMEKKHAEFIRYEYPDQLPKVAILEIEDVYVRNDPTLREALKLRAEPLIQASLREVSAG